MMRLDLQFFGGRGSSASSSSSGGSSAVSTYEQARSERQQLVANRASYDEIRSAMQRETVAANNMVASASDAEFDAGARKYFDDLGREEGTRTQERIINTLSRTNKNGSTSATATRAAEGYGDWVAQNVGNKLANTGAFHVNETNNKRGAEALIREAKRRRGI